MKEAPYAIEDLFGEKFRTTTSPETISELRKAMCPQIPTNCALFPFCENVRSIVAWTEDRVRTVLRLCEVKETEL